MSRFQPTPATAPMPTPNPMGIFPPVPPVIRPKTYSSTPLDAGIPTIAALQQRQEELTAPKMPAIQDPLQGAAYLTDILSTNLQENAALNMEGQQRQKLAEIAGGALGGGGVTPEMVKQAMAIDPEGMGAFLYKQAIDARNAERWEPYGNGLQRNTKTGEIKKTGAAEEGAGALKPSDLATWRDDYTKVSGVYDNASPTWQSMQASAKIALDPKLDAKGKGAADYALVVGLAKILDPTSVVREGEVESVRATGGAADYLVSYFNQLTSGGSLSDDVRRGIMQTGQDRMRAYHDQVRERRDWITKAVTAQGGDPNLVLPPLDEMPEWDAGGGGRDITNEPDGYEPVAGDYIIKNGKRRTYKGTGDANDPANWELTLEPAVAGGQ